MKKMPIFLLFLLLFQTAASAAALYVSQTGSGSACSSAAPCALNSAINLARAGDTIYLRTGFYGDLNISGRRNGGYVTIAAQPGHTPGAKAVVVRNSSRWIIRSLKISPELTSPYDPTYLIHIQSDSDDIVIEDNDLYYNQDSSGWTASDWIARTQRYALFTEGTNITIRNNHLKNVRFGIVVRGRHTLIESNIIENIGGDGISVNTSDVTIRYNTLKNFHDVDENHDDAIQFHRGGELSIPIENIIVRGNLIIGVEPHATHPLSKSPQGICGFDKGVTGFLTNFVVENNVVLVQQGHGISIYGATNSRIVNNTTFDPLGEYRAHIHLENRGQDTLVRNNIASGYTIGGTGMTTDHNIDIDDYGPGILFVDYQNYDVRHRKGSPAINAGSSAQAPDTDINGVSRPQGSGYDIGAYEYVTEGQQPPLSGDVSGNGEITSYDASLAAQYAINMIGLLPEEVERADVSGNDEVTSYDASLIAQYAIGLIGGF